MKITNRGIVTVAVGLLAAALIGCSSTQPAEQQVDDAWITSKVEGKLTADPEVNPFEIDVDTDDGVVRLSGMVETDAQREEAESLARNTKGVRDVENDIQLGDQSLGENVDDAWIVTKVKAKITADPELNPFNIDVDVVGAVVTLTGTVETEVDRDRAGEIARNVKHVKDVENKLKVKNKK